MYYVQRSGHGVDEAAGNLSGGRLRTKVPELMAVGASQNVGSDHMPRQLKSAVFVLWNCALVVCQNSARVVEL